MQPKVAAKLQIFGQTLIHPKNIPSKIKEREMKATIWHNPGCGTSRGVLEALQNTRGIDLTVIEYKKHPFDRTTLERLFTGAGLSAREALRVQGTEAEALGLTDISVTDAAILEHMMKDSMLVQRPFVETENGVRLCRPQDRLTDLL